MFVGHYSLTASVVLGAMALAQEQGQQMLNDGSRHARYNGSADGTADDGAPPRDKAWVPTSNRAVVSKSKGALRLGADKVIESLNG